MAQSYTRQSTFVDGDTITAALFNDEYNQLENAFTYSSSSASTTGHRHDGTAGHGGNVHTIGDLDFLNKIVADSTNNRWGFFVEVSSSAVEQIRIQDGAIVPVTDNDIDLGTSSLEFKDLFIDGTAHVDTLDVDANGTVAGTFGVTGATTLSSTLAVTGAVTGSSTIQGTTITATTAFVPDASDGAALGTSSLEFSDLFLADGAVVNFGDDQDVTLTHVADTGLLLNSTMALQFNDASQYINAPSATVLDINATDEIELNATLVDINANVEVSGTLTVAGAVDFGDAALSNVGAVQLDSIAGDGDTNTSITFSGSDVITIATGGSNRLTIGDGALSPSTDNEIDLGTSSLEFKDAYFDGTVTTDALVADTADINGGTVDGATIGANSATTIVGTTITANTAFVPDASDGAALGTSSLEFSDLFLADGAVINFGDDQDVSLTHVADTGLLLSSTDQLQFGDSGTYIHQSADGVLDLVSDTEIELTATTIDINGAVAMDGAMTGGTNITISGELDAATLDISGNADIDGTLEADAITVDGTTLAEYIADTAGAMFSSNTESGITVTYQDGDNTVDLAVDAAQTGITSLLATDIKIGEDDQTKIDFETADEIHFYASNAEQVYVADGIFGPQTDSDVDLGSTSVRWKDAFVDSITVTGEVDGASLDISGDADIDGTLEADAITVDGTALNEYIADTVGAMVTSNSESGITVTYQDGDNTLDFSVTGASVTNIADADSDTKIQVEESSDEDTIRMDIAGTEVLTLTNSAMTLKGTTPTFTIGDAGAEDTKIVFDGNAQDFYIGLDDSADDLIIGLGSTVGTTPIISVDENKDVAIPDGGLTITVSDNTDNLSLVSTDADANSGPNLRLYRNSSSPADNDALGFVEWEGRNDNSQDVIYGQIGYYATDVSDGTEDSNLYINTIVGGTVRNRINAYNNEVVINEESIDSDFRVESDNKQYALFVDGGNDIIGIGTSVPSSYNANADNVVIYDAGGHVGITLAGGTDDYGNIYFAQGTSGSDAYRGYIQYGHSATSDTSYRDVMVFGTATLERMRIDSTGVVRLKAGPTSYSTSSSEDSFIYHDNSGSTALKLGSNYEAAAAATHIMNRTTTIASFLGSGRVGIGTTGPRSVLDVVGDHAAGYIITAQNDGNNVNRYGIKIVVGSDDSSGTSYLLDFFDGDATNVGAVTNAGGTVSYGAFTAHHPCVIPDEDNNEDSTEPAYPYGTLLETTSLSYLKNSNGSDTERGIIYNVQKSSGAYSRKVLGAYGNSMNQGPQNETNKHQVLILGDGHILCNNEKGNISVGDGICTSTTAGIGMKADKMAMIIGIAQEDVTFSGSETKLVAVQYGLQQFTPWTD